MDSVDSMSGLTFARKFRIVPIFSASITFNDSLYFLKVSLEQKEESIGYPCTSVALADIIITNLMLETRFLDKLRDYINYNEFLTETDFGGGCFLNQIAKNFVQKRPH